MVAFEKGNLVGGSLRIPLASSSSLLHRLGCHFYSELKSPGAFCYYFQTRTRKEEILSSVILCRILHFCPLLSFCPLSRKTQSICYIAKVSITLSKAISVLPSMMPRLRHPVLLRFTCLHPQTAGGKLLQFSTLSVSHYSHTLVPSFPTPTPNNLRREG